MTPKQANINNYFKKIEKRKIGTQQVAETKDWEVGGELSK